MPNSFSGPGGITKLSELIIDNDKDWDGWLIQNLAYPIDDYDAATKGYVDSLSGLFNSRVSVYPWAELSVVPSTITLIHFDTVEFDGKLEFDAITNYRFQPVESGYYLVTAHLLWSPPETDKIYRVCIARNGGVIKDGAKQSSVAACILSTVVTAILYLTPSDYIDIRADHNGLVNATVQGGNEGTSLYIHRLS